MISNSLRSSFPLGEDDRGELPHNQERQIETMKLNPPFEISPRLLPAVRVGSAFVSIEFAGQTSDGRARYCYHIDTPDWEYTGADLKSGAGGGSLESGMESILYFLSACGEAVAYSQRTGRESENADLFPPHVAQWCYQNSDELSLLQFEISESETELIED